MSELAKIAAGRAEESQKKKKKRAKGPNPLSVKKKKPKEVPSVAKAAKKEEKTQSSIPKHKEDVRTGEKRPLPTDEGEHIGEVGIKDTEATVSGTSARGGHRKKRRRKGETTGDTSKPKSAESVSEED